MEFVKLLLAWLDNPVHATLFMMIALPVSWWCYQYARGPAPVEDDRLVQPDPPRPQHDVSWLWSLVQARHVLVVGQSGAGKTVLTHAVACVRARMGQRVVVCDPDARPGMWPDCEVVGGGDAFDAIEATLQQTQQEIEHRRQARAQGRREFGPMTLVWSEASDILNECPSARALFESLLRRARKLNVSLLMDVQDDQVGTLHLQGASKIKVNFSSVVEMSIVGEQRVARIGKEAVAVPQLPDPEGLADSYARQRPDLAVQPTQPVAGPPQRIATTENGHGGSLPQPEQPSKAPAIGLHSNVAAKHNWHDLAVIVKAGYVGETKLLKALGYQPTSREESSYQAARACLKEALAKLG